MANGLNIPQNLLNLDVEVSTLFTDLLERDDVAGVLDFLITRQTVSTPLTIYPFAGPANLGMQEWEDLIKGFDFPVYEQHMRTKRYALLYEYEEDKIADISSFDLAALAADRLSQAVIRHPSDLVFDALAAATSTLGYDGAPIFGTHNLGGGNYVNLVTSKALTPTNFDAALDAFGSIKLGAGKGALSYTPTHLLAPRSKRSVVKGIIESSTILRDGVSQENYNQGAVTPILSERIPDDTWYLVDATATPVILASKGSPYTEVQGKGSPTNFERGRIAVKAVDNYGVLFPDFGAWMKFTS